MKFLILSSILIFVSFFAKSQAIDSTAKPKHNNLYTHAIGLKILKGISYRYYYGNIAFEINTGFKRYISGFATPYYMDFEVACVYQKNTKRVFQPYFGATIKYRHTFKYTSYLFKGIGSASFTDKVVNATGDIFPNAIVGFEILPHNSRHGFNFDFSLGLRMQGNLPAEFSIGWRYRFL
ncbi:MAG: hypothetical protein EAZ53_16165 [Bacteroidetes bacterium]|nr:MAG: hypothetical protein EAZ53_16165 [Bacteroidota bacterium]